MLHQVYRHRAALTKILVSTDWYATGRSVGLSLVQVTPVEACVSTVLCAEEWCLICHSSATKVFHEYTYCALFLLYSHLSKH